MVTRSAQTSDISAVYQSLVQHRIHQDQLLWSRVQIIHAIQAGALAGGFALHFAWESSLLGGLVVVVIGGLLTLGMFVLVVGDYADMKVNVPVMDKLAKRLVPPDIERAIAWTDRTVLHRRMFVHGHYIIYASIIVVIVLDFVVGAFLLCRPSIFG